MGCVGYGIVGAFAARSWCAGAASSSPSRFSELTIVYHKGLCIVKGLGNYFQSIFNLLFGLIKAGRRLVVPTWAGASSGSILCIYAARRPAGAGLGLWMSS